MERATQSGDHQVRRRIPRPDHRRRPVGDIGVRVVQIENGPVLQVSMANSDHLAVDEPCAVTIEPQAISVWAAPD